MTARGQYAKGLAKREEILDLALELFAQKGYDRVSVREIAREAGLSQAGLLHHFSTKEELFLEVLRRRDDRDGDPINHRHLHSVEHLISAVTHNASDPGLVRLFVSMSAESAVSTSDVRRLVRKPIRVAPRGGRSRRPRSSGARRGPIRSGS